MLGPHGAHVESELIIHRFDGADHLDAEVFKRLSRLHQVDGVAAKAIRPGDDDGVEFTRCQAAHEFAPAGPFPERDGPGHSIVEELFDDDVLFAAVKEAVDGLQLGFDGLPVALVVRGRAPVEREADAVEPGVLRGHLNPPFA